MENNHNTMHANPFAGTGKVFSYSFRQMLKSKGWLITTLLMAGMLLIGIPLVTLCVTKAASKEDIKADESNVSTVYIADETAGEADYNVLKDTGSYTDVEYIACGSMDAAVEAAAGDAGAVILRVTKPEDVYALTVYLTDDTEVSRSKASSFASFAESNFSALLMQKADLTAEETALLSMKVRSETTVVTPDAEEKDADDSLIKQILEVFIPFMAVMMVYMMVILYGQAMANSVMLEKTSKLMETILTAVHPVALMTGKLLATACAAVLQIGIWMIAAVGGMIGSILAALPMILNSMNEGGAAAANMPDADKMAAVTEMLGDNFPAISVPGIFLTLVVMALGFLLYLAVATVSGAMASKQEDMGKTLTVFVLTLLISLMLCFSPEINEVSESISLISDAKWLRFFPFTGMLVLPADLIFGKLAGWEIALALLSFVAAVLLLVWLAAAVYKLLVLYRGNPPKLRQLIGMLRPKKDRKSGS